MIEELKEVLLFYHTFRKGELPGKRVSFQLQESSHLAPRRFMS